MKVMAILFAAVALTAAPILPMATATAQAVVSTGQSFVSARLLPGERFADGARLSGLRLSMAPGWKTYWRTPGEAGIPPQLDWSASQNVASVEVLWPRPQMFQSFGMTTVGYGDEVVLPVRVTPIDPAAPMRLALDAKLGVCRDICVLEAVTLAEYIAPDTGPIGHRQIDRAVARVPRPAADTGLTLDACRITGAGDVRQLDARFGSPNFTGTPHVLVEGSERLRVFGAKTQMTGDTVRVRADLHLPSEVSWVDRSALRFTVLADGWAADLQGCTPTGG